MNKLLLYNKENNLNYNSQDNGDINITLNMNEKDNNIDEIKNNLNKDY